MHVQKERGEGGRGEGLWSVGKGGALMIMIGQDKVGLWTRGSGVIKHHTSRKIRLIEIVLCIPRCCNIIIGYYPHIVPQMISMVITGTFRATLDPTSVAVWKVT